MEAMDGILGTIIECAPAIKIPPFPPMAAPCLQDRGLDKRLPWTDISGPNRITGAPRYSPTDTLQKAPNGDVWGCPCAMTKWSSEGRVP
ncbi:hypothetical protein TNIN_208111 [Trichonephila inaurata madagascariensis]|uniref:Uncharacterized protein n=1 Tax=Trichonephila inaurata madagascariensis TaxID=2747483 RepID=A0A8X7BZY7_9ARAC|nr:hypothetical protein TNIN_453691 [Trichonephila inaurata madagascariensis]GFY50145.1 hypothetical protein TNIN_208111 [Trichonephila inaurata madagascariensis]